MVLRGLSLVHPFSIAFHEKKNVKKGWAKRVLVLENPRVKKKVVREKWGGPVLSYAGTVKGKS